MNKRRRNPTSVWDVLLIAGGGYVAWRLAWAYIGTKYSYDQAGRLVPDKGIVTPPDSYGPPGGLGY